MRGGILQLTVVALGELGQHVLRIGNAVAIHVVVDVVRTVVGETHGVAAAGFALSAPAKNV